MPSSRPPGSGIGRFDPHAPFALLLGEAGRLDEMITVKDWNRRRISSSSGRGIRAGSARSLRAVEKAPRPWRTRKPRLAPGVTRPSGKRSRRTGGGTVRRGSTITQQLAKNLFLTREEDACPEGEGDLRGALTMRRRDRILELYLNAEVLSTVKLLYRARGALLRPW